ncbi:hypothetical protein HYC85_014266 [Camellia sinensis]|uniref:O-acyltransferase WSD1 C-terminal domain-containing protein n=1 Tax=Camellia sinensis TaxID=4442 RepID=A0A7J7H604_CAMSI|nr:hypothetical protein HYC85_014266 [Camellia sinensis]
MVSLVVTHKVYPDLDWSIGYSGLDILWLALRRAKVRAVNGRAELMLSQSSLRLGIAMLTSTVNDVITGIIFLGTRLYMKETGHENELNKSNSKCTALVLLNTRNVSGYTSVEEMIKPNITDTKWGNQFGFLHVSVPELGPSDSSNPINFVFKAQQVILRKRNSAAVFLTGKLLDTSRKYRGPEATARYIHSTLKNSSMTVSNMIGPIEQMALANDPCSGIYFMVVGVPQSLTITMVSYMGNLRVAVGTEKGYIDSKKYKSCIQNAFHMMFKAAVKSASQPPNYL